MAGSQQGWRSVGSGGGGGGSVISVTASAPVVSSGGANPNISMAKADSTTNGYLSASDWTAFNNKLSSAFNQQIQDEGNNVPQRNVINFVGNGVSVTDTGGKTQVSITSGQGNSIYYLNLSVSESPYSQFSSNPVSGSQQSVTANISGSSTSTIASFQTPIGIPNTTNLIGGLWSFFLHFGTSSSSTDFTIYVEVYKRTNVGAETLILTTDSFTTSTLSSTPVMILTDGVLPNTTLLTTDRIVVKVVVVNNKPSSHNITFYTEGTTNYSVSYTTLGQSIPSGAVTNVTASSPLTSSGGTTPNLAIPQANGSTNGFLSASNWTDFNNKQNTITGGASTITTSNLSPSFALQSNASGKVEVSTVTSTELGYVSGVTSSIQTQLNSKQNALVNPVTGTGASGQVSFWSGTNTQSGSNNFFWDNTNNALGLGASPLSTSRLDIRAKDNLSTSQSLRIQASTGGTTTFEVRGDGNTLITGDGNHAIQTTNGGISISRSNISFMDLINTSSGKSTYRMAGDSTNFSDAFYIRNTTSSNYPYVQFSNGNTVIGSNTIPTDGGFKLDVNGTARVQGNLTVTGNSVILPAATGVYGSSSVSGVHNSGGTAGYVALGFNSNFSDRIGLYLFQNSNNPQFVFGRPTLVQPSNIKFEITGSQTALVLGTLAVGTSISNTLVASANNQTLVGLDVAPTFTTGAFTGITNTALRVTGDVLFGSNFIWDNTNNALGLGASPLSTARLDIRAKDNLSTSQSFRIGRSTDNAIQFRITGEGQVGIFTSVSNQLTIDNVTGLRINVDSNGFAMRDTNGYGFSNTTSSLDINASNTVGRIRIWSQASNTMILNLGGQDIAETTARKRTTITPVGDSAILFSPTSGTAIDYSFETEGNSQFAPISGTATYTQIQLRPTINTTGTYVGTVRGLYYNPTLTSLTGTTHRAIETTSGDVIFGNGRVAIGGGISGSVTLNVTGTSQFTDDVTLSKANHRLTFTGGTASGGLIGSNGTFRISGQGSGTNTDYTSIALVNVGDISSGNTTAISGTINLVAVGSNSYGNQVAPTSGNLTYNTLVINTGINTTGTYSGIIRGLYYNPVIVSSIGLTNRAIETVVGDVIFNSTSGNVAIGGTSFGTSANRVLAVYNGTAPASSPLDSFQMYSADIPSTSTAAPHFRNENGNIIKLYQETAVTTAQGIATALTNLGVLATSTIPQSGYTLIFGHTSATLLANNTYDIGALTYLPPTNATSNSISRRFRVPKTGIVKKVSILTVCGNQSSLSPSPTLRLNNFTTSTVTTITTTNLYNNGGAGAFARNNVFSPIGGIAVTEADEINIQSVIPNWITAPQIDNFILTLWIEET
jgi:hypothetical protein